MTRVYPGRSGPALAEVAARQHAVFTRAQALACGVTSDIVDRRVATGVWERLYPGVYRLAGVPKSWRQALLAACFAWGEGVVSSHRAAGALFGFPRFKPCIELSVPRKRERAHPHLVHRPMSLTRADLTVVDEIPVTTAARTLIDLAACVEADVLEEALDDALRRRLVTVARVRWRMQELGARAGNRTLTRLIDARATTTRAPESVLETKLLRVLRDAGLPTPAVQHVIGRYRLDFAYVDARVAIEADGFQWHSTRQQWDRDRARRNALTTMGWIVLHVSWTQLSERPEEVVEAVRALIG